MKSLPRYIHYSDDIIKHRISVTVRLSSHSSFSTHFSHFLNIIRLHSTTDCRHHNRHTLPDALTVLSGKDQIIDSSIDLS